MQMDQEILDYLNRSVLCWLATSSLAHIPNVSPKEVFMPYEGRCIIIANIASPQSVKNMKENEQVCLSFIDIFTQKGVQLKGVAEIITKEHPEYAGMKAALETMTKGKFPFSSISKITVHKRKPIIAPSYILFPETSEQDQIKAAEKSYRVKKLTTEADQTGPS